MKITIYVPEPKNYKEKWETKQAILSFKEAFEDLCGEIQYIEKKEVSE